MDCLTWKKARMFCALLAVGSVALAQEGAVKRAVIDRADGSQGSEALFATAELAPGESIGMHTHPGIEMAYVMEGELELLVGGISRRYKQGESFRIAAGTAHDARNTHAGPIRVIGVWLIEKGKPLSKPVR